MHLFRKRSWRKNPNFMLLPLTDNPIVAKVNYQIFFDDYKTDEIKSYFQYLVE